MDFTNLKMSFECYRNTPMTIYTFGKKRKTVGIVEINKNLYCFNYYGSGVEKITELTSDLPKLLAIEIIQLYNGFGIDSKRIESCIKSIQAWKRRNTKTKNIEKRLIETLERNKK